MILTRIKASNVLKYGELHLRLPEKGLIAISGQNESGKSSIGETVCFALFGRTFSIPPEDLEKVVRWGENHCAVTLEFQVGENAYVLSRFLDRDGNHSAKLTLAGNDDKPLARGVDSVAEALAGILGYGYAEFVESFYLAQREITTPHPHSHAVKIMAGVAPLEGVAKGLQKEIAEREELIEELKDEYEAVENEIQTLGITEGHMVRLEDTRYETGRQIELIEGISTGMGERMQTYRQNAVEISVAERRRARNSAMRALLLLLVLALGGLWGLLTYGAQVPELIALQAQVQDLLANKIPDWHKIQIVWIGYAAIATFVVMLLFGARISSARRHIDTLRGESALLGETMAQAREIEIEDESFGDAADEEESDAGDDADDQTTVDAPEDTPAMPERPAYAEYLGLHDSVIASEAGSGAVANYIEREIAWLNSVAEQLRTQAEQLDEEINDEQARIQEALNLTDVIEGLNEKRNDVEERIAVRRRAVELLTGSTDHLTNHFNRDVKDLVGRLLPLFTDGRYEHLQIDTGLNVRVFSADKRDFMDLEEVSSGTQRQIMLALRLALSQKLLTRAVKGKQFAFLDEPFAFFDEERTRSALLALSELGDDISQVWIVAQSFPEDSGVDFDATIVCKRESDSLQVPA